MRAKSFSKSLKELCVSVLVLAIVFGVKASGNQGRPRENA